MVPLCLGFGAYISLQHLNGAPHRFDMLGIAAPSLAGILLAAFAADAAAANPLAPRERTIRKASAIDRLRNSIGGSAHLPRAPLDPVASSSPAMSFCS